jgi:uncharacterized protein with HEPN domain
MPSKPADTALRDILHHIRLATSFSAGFEHTAFGHDLKTVYAVTRCLEIISEASRRLPDDVRLGIQQSAGSKWQGPETYIATTMKTSQLSLSGKR